MKVTKAAGVELSGAPSEEQLEKINRLTKAKVAEIRSTGTTSGSRRRASGSWQRFLSGRRGSWTTLGRRKSRWRGFLTRRF